MDKNKSPGSFRANLKATLKASLKEGDAKRMKRTKIIDDTMWDCSVCTYRNSVEAFKCLMCDVRKGTSTRKPRLNPELVAAQVAQVVPPPKLKKTERKERRSDGRPLQRGRPRLKNVDRSTAEHNAVTVNNVTVIITEFQPKQRTANSGNASTNGDTSQIMSSSEAGSISDASTDTRNGELGATEYRSS